MQKHFHILVLLPFLVVMAFGCSDSDDPVDTNRPPSAAIKNPQEGAVFTAGDTIQFIGTYEDVEDNELKTTAIVWESDIDGEFGAGTMLYTDTLSAGAHTITLTVTDTGGKSRTAMIAITINEPVDSAPTVTVTGPEDGAIYKTGDIVHLTGTGSDAEDGDLTGDALAWTSDVDGPLCTGADCGTSALSVGTHHITLTCTDTAGNSSTASVAITIEQATDTPPTVTIQSPADETAYALNDPVQFSGTAVDSKGASLSGEALTWTSDIDAVIGTGQSVTSDALTAGTHTISLSAVDADERRGEASITITIIANAVANDSFPLPDTGQTTSYTDIFGEDSDYNINPPSYTKMDAQANDLPDTAETWRMVRDNVTGLIWEVKTDDAGLNDKGGRYTWEGAQETHIGLLNQTNFGGYSDWRLPTVKELCSLVNLDAYDPAVNTVYFPNGGRGQCWTSNSNARLEESAWVVNTRFGHTDTKLTGETAYVRAVRK